jgi:aminoglycoside phosphotransferase (APT) family kinase protein
MVARQENQARLEGHAGMSTDIAAYAGTSAVREGHQFDEAALTRWMVDNVAGFAGPLRVEQFKGGQSNPTYKLSTPDRAYVLRRKPSGDILKGAHAVEREARVLAAVRPHGFPVAEVFGLCTDDTVIGSWFFVMEMVEGRIFWDATFPGVGRERRGAYFDAMNQTIAALHRLDPDVVGLGDYGRPGNYFERQIARWSRQYLDDADAGRDPGMDRLVEWLPQHVSAGDESAIVHGDFRCDNMIFHPTEPRVLAVLDWELSTLGHPLADFAYHAMMYRMPPDIVAGLADADIEVLGIPKESEYVSDYCRRTGRPPVSERDWAVAMTFNLFRLAAIFHGIKGRVIRGTAASAHARQRAEKLPRLIELAVRSMDAGQ